MAGRAGRSSSPASDCVACISIDSVELFAALLAIILIVGAHVPEDCTADRESPRSPFGPSCVSWVWSRYVSSKTTEDATESGFTSRICV